MNKTIWTVTCLGFAAGLAVVAVAGCGDTGAGPGPKASAVSPEDAKPVVVINGKTITRAAYEDVLYERFATNHLENFIEEQLLEEK
ncbi:MAG: hypothetical protein AAFX99_32640, partial [Myxococcota bacterium]